MTGPSVRQSKLFSKLRFWLAGFDESYKNQFVDELLENGGQIVERYEKSCTHVIVSNLTYDDPICALARKDGKALVTEVWVADCLDHNTLGDLNSVLYRPLKDLDGISGSENLCMCLTGYQGQGRQKIMRMVELMGAKFTKPLISSLVTHLICYKFEGEKYELAKKTGLKLVNHFWLEDCLKAWTLLPESDYAQSGQEAESRVNMEKTYVQDSPEEETIVSDEKFLGDNLQVLSRTPTEVPEEKRGTDIVDHHHRTSSMSSARKESLTCSHPSPAPESTSKQQVTSKIEHNAGVSTNANKMEEIKTDCKPSAEDFPLDLMTGKSEDVEYNAGVSTNANKLEEIRRDCKPSAEDFPLDLMTGKSEDVDRGSALAGQEDETTDLYVDGDDNHSSGRSSYQEMDKVNDMVVEAKDVSGPVTTAIIVGNATEMTGVITEHPIKRRISGAEDPETNACEDDKSESPGSKRRKCSLLGSKKQLSPGTTRCSSAELPKDSTNTSVTEVTCLENNSCVNQQPFALEGSGLDQRMFLKKTGNQQLSEDLVGATTGSPRTSSGIDKSAKIVACNRLESGKLFPNIRNDIGNAQACKGREHKEHKDGDGADYLNNCTNQGNFKCGMTLSSPKPICTDEEEIVNKRNGSGNSENRVTLVQLAQSRKPTCRERGNQKHKPACKDKENLSTNETNQKVPTNKVQKQPGTKRNCESPSAPCVDSSQKCFVVGGSTDERTRLHSLIKVLGGSICKSRYQWRNESTHVILPGPLRRTEKFLAGVAAGRWILKPEYLDASAKAGKLLDEEAYEWYGEGMNDKGNISLQAPRKWRILQGTSGCGAFHSLRVVFYGECISPPLDTLKRAIKAGGGLVLATSPPFTRHFSDGVDFAIISPGIPKEDKWVEEFLKHDVACVTSDYLVDVVCHPSSALEKHFLYGTSAAVNAGQWENKGQPVNKRPSFSQEVEQKERAPKMPLTKPEDVPSPEDTSCSVCGRTDDEDVMLLCGDEKGAGCGRGVHIHCLTPPLQSIPDEDWFCLQCEP